jgi:hypothetical protein
MRIPRPLLASLLLSTSFLGHAQGFGTLDANDVRMVVHANGFIGSNPGVPVGVEIPAFSGLHTMSAGGLWVTGMTSDGQGRVAAHLYPGAQDFVPGPLTTDGSASITPETILQYDRVWLVSTAQIELHQAYFACLQDPDCDVNAEFPGGYTIPPTFLSWPAMGDVSAGQATYLAPFVDIGADGSYEPENGDHPCILGDKALYAIFNDVGGEHLASGSPAIGLEVHLMAFAYDNNPALDQTVFVQHKIIQRGSSSLTDLHIGHYADFDIGCSNDDIIGTDVLRSLVYVLNGDDTDEDCSGVNGYGASPPIFGLAVLKGPLLDADGIDNALIGDELYVNGTGYGDGAIDNERFGLSGSLAFYRDGSPFMTDPTTPAHFLGYNRMIWKNNLMQIYGGIGYDPSPGANPALFCFPGSSDPNGLGTNNVPQLPWSADLDVLGSTRDPRIVGSMGPRTLEPGDNINLLVAYTYVRSGASDPLSNVTALQARVDSITTFARNIPGMFIEQTSGAMPCAAPNAPNAIGEIQRATLTLFPVPADGELYLRAIGLRSTDMISIHDMQGRLVMSSQAQGPTTRIEISALPPGAYAVRANTPGMILNGRFIKE